MIGVSDQEFNLFMCFDKLLNADFVLNHIVTGRGLGLSLSGLRVGPLDPKSKVPKVGANL